MTVRPPMRAVMVALALALVATLPASAAAAAETLRGTTSQQRSISLRLGDDGRLQRLRFDWVARCRNARLGSYASRTLLTPPLRESTAARFGDTGTYTSRDRGGYTARVAATTTGVRRAAGRWSGTFRLTMSVRRAGRALGTCRTPVVRWSVRR